MRKFLALLLTCVMVLGLAACGTPAAPSATEAVPETVTVSNMDEFLAALGSCRTIVMEPGYYCLSDAADYGEETGSVAYEWEDTYDGYELTLKEVQELTIIGGGMGKTVLEALPRMAYVLTLMNCNDVTLQGITIGHVEMAEGCEGGVVRLDDCTNVHLEGLGLYGCGTDGVFANDCRNITVNGCHIYDCSANGIVLDECSNVSICNSMIYDLGGEVEDAFSFLDLWNCDAVTVDNCSVFNCDLCSLICLYTDEVSEDIVIKNTAFHGNWVSIGAFEIYDGTITMDNCVFAGNQVDYWYAPDVEFTVKRADGTRLSEEDFMMLNSGGYTSFTDVPPGDVTVSNIDEFLAALGSYRTITMEPGNYCLSDAAGYGMWSDNPYYDWVEGYDGYELNLNDIEELTIIGSGTDQTFLEALPRSVAVMHLTNCFYITVRDMTIGHVEMAQACEGAVLELDSSAAVNLENLGLYGCGTVGVSAFDSGDIAVSGCHIYDCSTFGLFLYNCDNVNITGCTIDHIGTEGDGAMSILDVNWCGTITMDSCIVSDCNVSTLVYEMDCMGDIVIRNTTFRDNRVKGPAFEQTSEFTTVDGCTFAGNTVRSWYDPASEFRVKDGSGEPISEMAFWTMNN